VVSSKPRPHLPPGKTWYPLYRRLNLTARKRKQKEKEEGKYREKG